MSIKKRTLGGVETPPTNQTESCGSDAINVLVKIFDVGFFIIALLAAICVLLLFILSAINLGKYHREKRKFNSYVKHNTTVIIRETLDYKLLAYTGNKTSKTEPLFIETIITVTNSIFMLLALYIIILGIELGILIGITLYKSIKGANNTVTNENNKINIGEKMFKLEFIIIIICSSFAASIIFAITRSLYRDKTLPSLKKTQMLMYNMKENINKNLYIANNDYLEALRNDNLNVIMGMIEKNNSSLNNDIVTKMIFTYNIYENYKKMYNQDDSRAAEIKNKFKQEVLKGTNKDSTFEPAEYLLYTDTDKDKLEFTDHFNNLDKTSYPNINQNYKRDSILYTNVNDKLDAVNEISRKLNKQTLENNKENLVKYINSVFIYSFFGLIILLVGVAVILLKNPDYLQKLLDILSKMGSVFKR